MQLLQKPFMKLLLKPHFDKTGDASSISITLTLEEPMTRAGKPLYVFITYSDNVDCYQYKESDLQATDNSGNLPLHFKEGSSRLETREQLWLVDRNTHGNVTLRFHVYPREVDVTTPLGARIDIRRDQGGLLGSGRWFLPRPPTDFLYRHIVEWDLSLAPHGTRAIWTFGEGSASVENLGRSDFMIASLYMVGPIQSYPSQPMTELAASQTEGGFTGFYWFGQLPANLKQAAKLNNQLFLKMASFFKTPAGPDQTYRVFVRKSLRGYGGTGFESSYVLEYDEETQNVPDVQMTELLSHEMVHSWGLIRREEGANMDYWYEEGVADLYATYLPYRFGLSDREYFRNSLNSHLLLYYASPAIHMSDDEAVKNLFTDWSAEKVIYARGSTYLLIIDCAIRRAIRARQEKGKQDLNSALETPFDTIIIDLATRYRKGKYFRIGDWLDRIGKYLDRSEAETFLRAMTQGQLTLDIGDIGAKFLHGDERLVQVEREQPEMGFDRPAFQARRIEGLVLGSRAARAGLRNGDRILSAEGVSLSQEIFEMRVRMTVERNGEEIEVEYWPRSFTKVMCWQVMQVGEGC